jgi:transposase InsO family protein
MGSRLEICCGLHAVAHRRSARLGLLRPFHDANGPTASPFSSRKSQTEAVRDDSPFRRGPLHRLTDVELLTADWVRWHNTTRPMHRLGRIPPIEYETVHYATNTAQSEAAHQ